MHLDNPYLTDQLVPYLGNKRKLLPLISEAISKAGVKGGTFLDLFSGSSVVSRFAKTLGFRVIANDWEPYTQVVNRAYIQANRPPAFESLSGLDRAIHTLNDLQGTRGYIARHYCPADDDSADAKLERMFYTQRNGRRIDVIREQIKQWREEGRISSVEEAVLLAPLIYQASYCSNTSGVFKAYHNGWGGTTQTALYRILSHLHLKPPLFHDNGQENVVIREDAADAAGRIECDIAYLDPPYNQHQYGSNYHMLNTIALWDKPPLSERVSGNGERDKAGIRKDWRTLRRSKYCYKSSASSEFANLVESLRCGCILTSYSTDGIVDVRDLLDILGQRGELTVIPRKYKRYRVSSQRPSPRPHTTEFVAIVDTSKRGGRQLSSPSVQRLLASVETSN